MKLVVDASVVVKTLIDEPLSDVADNLLFHNDEVDLLIAPDLLIVEVGNVLWKHFRLGQITQSQINQAKLTLPSTFTLIPSEFLFSRALDFAQKFDHPIYDCFYLAAAERWETKLITDDRRLANKITDPGLRSRIQLLQPAER